MKAFCIYSTMFTKYTFFFLSTSRIKSAQPVPVLSLPTFLLLFGLYSTAATDCLFHYLQMTISTLFIPFFYSFKHTYYILKWIRTWYQKQQVLPDHWSQAMMDLISAWTSENNTSDLKLLNVAHHYSWRIWAFPSSFYHESTWCTVVFQLYVHS